MSARTTFWATVALLATFNVARGLGALGSWSDVAAVGLALAVATIAWRSSLALDDLGLARDDLRRGIAYGGVALALTVVVVGAAALVPATSGFLDDARARISGGELAWEVVFAIGLATVVPEELAFRGVLLGAGTRLWGATRAALVSSALFGLWHVSPTLRTMGDNDTVRDVATGGAADVAVVAGAVAATFAAGLVFCWLRLRSRSLAAPALAHLGTNAVALVVAWLVTTGG